MPKMLNESAQPAGEALLELRKLRVSFNDGRGGEVVRGIDLAMEEGETLGLVGESGSGKTVTALTIAGLLSENLVTVSGEIIFGGKDLLKCSRSELRALQGRDIGMIFQEPMTSLDPLMRIGFQVEEPLRLHTKLPYRERRKKALEVMGLVDLPEPSETYRKFPHQLSGGQRQRAMIASAFITHPKLLILDEPTTALDVTVQKQILDLLRTLNERHSVGLLFISHDLRVVRHICRKVAVMYQGEIVEYGDTAQVFSNPQHEYTQRLVAAVSAGRRVYD
ncbi:MAG: ABC transporter ATP-binding protein [Oscillospiraceae bacterium]|jgi:ABC-type microcin C transport system duplicated ATPase subunit YejF|nr:ABC transporter ATP-binding protein [Oscillospiraceae bacterium]